MSTLLVFAYEDKKNTILYYTTLRQENNPIKYSYKKPPSVEGGWIGLGAQVVDYAGNHLTREATFSLPT